MLQGPKIEMGMSRSTLLGLLTAKGTAYCAIAVNGKPTQGILNSVLREDGSGYSFVANVATDDKDHKVYVRTAA